MSNKTLLDNVANASRQSSSFEIIDRKTNFTFVTYLLAFGNDCGTKK